MSRNRLLAWALCVWTAALAVGWLLAYIRHSDDMLPLGPAELLTMAVGGFLLSKGSGGLIGVVMMIGGSAGLIYDLGTVYASVSMERPDALPAEHLAAWLGMWTGSLAFIAIPALLVLYPEGSFRGRRVWWALVFAVVASAVLVGAGLMWTAPTSVLISLGSGGDPPGYPAYELVNVGFLSWMLFIPAALTLAHRWRRGSRVERLQIGWLLAAALVVPPAAIIASRLGVDGRVLLMVAPCAVPVAIGIAITRYRLYDLGRIVSRTLAYTLVVVLLGAVFALGVVAIPNLVLGAGGTAPPLVVAASTLAVAALFNPLRKRVLAWVDRRFNRAHYDAERVMDEFGQSLSNQSDPDSAVAGWVDVVSDTMEPAAIGVWVRE